MAIEIIERVTSEGDAIEDEHAGRAERLRQDGISFLPMNDDASGNQTHPNNEPNDDACDGWNEIVIKRVFHEEGDTEEQRQTA